MTDDVTSRLSVTVKDLQPVQVAYVEFKGDFAEGEHSHEIGGCFQVVRSWVASLGYDLNTLLHIGIVRAVEGRPIGYECCVEIPAEVAGGPEGISIKKLVGGKYAVLSIDKDPSACGPAIGRFHREYVPQSGLEIDGTRPIYEIYYERTMAYCVPIV
jgi:DNA gyrase inhibitor GyrI